MLTTTKKAYWLPWNFCLTYAVKKTAWIHLVKRSEFSATATSIAPFTIRIC
jgi:hypothetical protein